MEHSHRDPINRELTEAVVQVLDVTGHGHGRMALTASKCVYAVQASSRGLYGASVDARKQVATRRRKNWQSMYQP